MKKFEAIVLTGDALKGGAIKLTQDQTNRLGFNETTDEVRGELKTWGPWQLPVSYRALCESVVWTPTAWGSERTGVTLYGPRTLSHPRQSGYCLEGRVSVNGKDVRGFTSSILFELPSGHLIDVATVFACVKDN